MDDSAASEHIDCSSQGKGEFRQLALWADNHRQMAFKAVKMVLPGFEVVQKAAEPRLWALVPLGTPLAKLCQPAAAWLANVKSPKLQKHINIFGGGVVTGLVTIRS
jgi:hypothetical protein